jgi:hypothetical protein
MLPRPGLQLQGVLAPRLRRHCPAGVGQPRHRRRGLPAQLPRGAPADEDRRLPDRRANQRSAIPGRRLRLPSDARPAWRGLHGVVVRRLPNVTGDTGPAYLLGLLGTAGAWTDRPATAYNGFLGISAQVWQKSSELSLDALFGTHAGMKIAPPDGFKWTVAEANPLSHFVNCHGAAATPFFYGQKGSSYPVAHSAAWMTGKVSEGTVMAAECCYGAELYDPSLPTATGQMGMCNTYLAGAAYAYFGSSPIAYGPAATNDPRGRTEVGTRASVLSRGRGASGRRVGRRGVRVGQSSPGDDRVVGHGRAVGWSLRHGGRIRRPQSPQRRGKIAA